MNCVNVYPWCCDICLCSSEIQINQSDVPSSKATVFLHIHTRWFCRRSPLSGHQRSWLEAQTQDILHLPPGSLKCQVWMVVLLKLLLLAVQYCECVCAYHYWLDFRRYTALCINSWDTTGQLWPPWRRERSKSTQRRRKQRKKNWVQSENKILGCVRCFVANIDAHVALLWKSQMPHDRQQVKGEQLFFFCKVWIGP